MTANVARAIVKKVRSNLLTSIWCGDTPQAYELQAAIEDLKLALKALE